MSNKADFYYFDGKVFQKAMTLNSAKGLPLNKIEDELHYLVGDEVETFLTLSKIKKLCFFHLKNLNSLMYILTDNGWELITTESMEIADRKLAVIDRANIIVKPVLRVEVDEKKDFNIYEFSELEVIGEGLPIVRPVPNIKAIDRLELDSLNPDNLRLEGDVVIAFMNNKNCEVLEIGNLNKLTTEAMKFRDGIVVIINDEEV